jgi:hypothetical protein
MSHIGGGKEPLYDGAIGHGHIAPGLSDGVSDDDRAAVTPTKVPYARRTRATVTDYAMGLFLFVVSSTILTTILAYRVRDTAEVPAWFIEVSWPAVFFPAFATTMLAARWADQPRLQSQFLIVLFTVAVIVAMSITMYRDGGLGMVAAFSVAIMIASFSTAGVLRWLAGRR